jgi:hypothetical protein
MKFNIHIVLFLNIILASIALYAQDENKFIKISGFIFDEVSEEPLPGANV